MTNPLDLNGKKWPLYVQIKDRLLEDIRSGVLQPGDAIKTEAQLSEVYSVSRATVRQAVTELVHDGYLVRQQGRGTFVNKPRIDTPVGNMYSFTKHMEERGHKPEFKIIDFEIIMPKASVREKLGLREKQLVYRLVRQRSLDGEPIMVETTFIPMHLLADLDQEKINAAKSLYSLLEKEYHIRLDHMVEYFEPVLIDDLNSILLNVPKGAPALYFERVGYVNNSVYELSQSIIRGDRCRYFVEWLVPKQQ
ncbi:GntR family transcriptional regulator [Cohnella sp. REN36]|uniref:GntR family transcriptional regulator n=1 Tax=Cohnella sp. REN36 TaxID=2887347 RepID=UPI001D1329AC|nr:GntR family transcriptional regulator [Cohnella sp. REN36]MCC3374197.1 GntR family transcriptional regulator [Cohnella sp. REN36]